MNRQHIAKERFFRLAQGMNITGQKHGHRYTIRQKLMDHPFATTYLCHIKEETVILNIGKPTKQLLSTITNIQTISKAQGNRLGLTLHDIDQWQSPSGETYIFYVTSAMEGILLQTFLQQKRCHWLPLFIYQLLDQLQRIHDIGFVVGYMTLEQLYVTESKKLCLCSLNGLIKNGEYMQWFPTVYEQSYWLLSSRRALPSNDLFSMVIIVLNLFYPKQISHLTHSKQQLIQKITALPLSVHYKQCFLKAVLGKYETAKQMKKEFLIAIDKTEQINYLTKRTYRTSLGEATAILSLSLCCLLSVHLFF